jgi:NADH:ubiquinone oxidoreductase subunit 5 (subunit L)/multisubunit Na+/H+ antiporter MnhA subunit
MTISPLVIGILLCVIGAIILLYAEYLRKKEEMDINNFILYISGFGAILIGVVYFINNF